MKKNFLTLSAFCLLLSLSSCELGTKHTQQLVNNEQTASSAFAIETISVEKGTESKSINFKYDIDFPQEGPEALTTAVKQTIFQTLGDSTTTDFSIENLNKIGERYVADSQKDMEEFGDMHYEEGRTVYELSGNVKMEENTDKYLTYAINDYSYAGGAHGITREIYLTFNKSTSQLMQWEDIFPASNREQLGELVKAAIVEQYYRGEHEWDDFFKFTLPAQAPAFTTDGLLFIYAAYEIDAYAAGLPKCVIPYENLKSLMTPEAQALVD